MTMTYNAFRPHRPLRQYRGQAGHEANGTMLPTYAQDALAASMTSDIPCELVAVGEYVRDDGARFLNFAVTRGYIEALTDYLDEGGRLRLVCPQCEGKDGNHLKSCNR
jgi:hypothetical protein